MGYPQKVKRSWLLAFWNKIQTSKKLDRTLILIGQHLSALRSSVTCHRCAFFCFCFCNCDQIGPTPSTDVPAGQWTGQSFILTGVSFFFHCLQVEMPCSKELLMTWQSHCQDFSQPHLQCSFDKEKPWQCLSEVVKALTKKSLGNVLVKWSKLWQRKALAMSQWNGQSFDKEKPWQCLSEVVKALTKKSLGNVPVKWSKLFQQVVSCYSKNSG